MALKKKFAEHTEALNAQVGAGEISQPVDRPARKGPATAPGGMLAFQNELNASNEEKLALQERLKSFEASLQVVLLDPSKISISKFANRHEDSYASAEFESLKADIAASKGNVQPIKVRPIKGKLDQYELIFGHRRHRASLELSQPVLSMIESVDDAALFLEMDRENREREDLSPYEQGLHYKRAMDLKVFKSVRALAQALEIAHSSVSRAVALAALPDPVIAAFRSPLELQFRWGKAIADALAKDEKGVLGRAAELAARQTKPAGAVVTQMLCGASQDKVADKTVKPLGRNGEATLTEKDGAISIVFPKGVLSSRKMSELASVVEDFINS